MVEVVQADRDAAADLIERYFHDEAMLQLATDYRGGYQFGPFSEAFAAHRIASLSGVGEIAAHMPSREAMRAKIDADPDLETEAGADPDLAATEIGQLVNRILALAPIAGLYVGVTIGNAPPEPSHA